VFFCLLTAAVGSTRVLGNPSNAKHRQPFIYILRQSASGSNNYTLDTKFRLGSDVAVSPSAGANKQDYLGVIYDANDDKFDVVSFVRNF